MKEVSHAYLPIILAILFTILNFLAVVMASHIYEKTRSSPSASSLCGSVKKKLSLMGISSVLFLLFLADLSRNQLITANEFPLSQFIFLMGFSLGLIVLSNLDQVVPSISLFLKMVILITYVLLEENVCLEIIFATMESAQISTLGAFVLLALFFCEFFVHLGLYTVFRVVWDQWAKFSKLAHTQDEDSADQYGEFENEGDLPRFDIEMNQRKPTQDITSNSNKTKENYINIQNRHENSEQKINPHFQLFPILLVFLLMLCSLSVVIYEEFGHPLPHHHLSYQIYQTSFITYNQKFWAVKQALSGVILLLIFPHLFQFFNESASRQQDDAEEGKTCNKQFRRRNGLFACVVFSFFFAAGRYLAQEL